MNTIKKKDDYSRTWLKVQENTGDVMNTQTTTEVEHEQFVCDI
jgi:hypothetical protein